jgi:hypothetical protein
MADIPSEISPEVSSKYSIDAVNNVFSATPKDDPKDRVQIELGDSKNPTDFLPQFKVMRWGKIVI